MNSNKTLHPLVIAQAVKTISDGTKEREKLFWQQWGQYRDYLYHCCLKWMRGNAIDAEEVLSQAMLKAIEKIRQGSHIVTNFKAWLTRLTYNLCMDIHREYKMLGNRVESLEIIFEKGDDGLVSSSNSPESWALECELGIIIHRVIEDLPPRLREPFVLYFIEEKSYQDIAQELGISYDNLCKRISQARGIVQKRLTRYLSGLEQSSLLPFKLPDKKKITEVESFDSNAIIRADSEITPPSRQKEGFDRSLNYQVSAICLETLPHAWYHSPSPLGWS